MTSHSDVVDRFVERGRSLKGKNVYADSDTIYSYGSHFPMAIALDDRNFFVVNGDTWGPTTSHHQNQVRDAIQRKHTWESVIIPFSALEIAGIDRRSIVVIDDGNEINEYVCNTCGVRQEAVFPESDAFIKAHPTKGELPKMYIEQLNCGKIAHHQNRWHPCEPNPKYQPHAQAHDRLYRHLLAPSLITGVRSWREPIIDGPCAICDAPKIEHGIDGVKNTDPSVSWSYRHTYRQPTQSIAETHYFLSGFDETARAWGGGYFLSQLPHAVNNIEEAFESLAPEAVREAINDGKFVKRQGDIFGVPDADITTRFLSKNGVRLPRQRVKTETLYDWENKPWKEVTEPSFITIGDQRIPDFEDGTFRYHKNGYRPQLLGTNHYATEAFEYNGDLYARGSLYHIPSSRQPDHKVIRLGKVWHKIYRNTALGSWSATRSRGRVD